MNSGKSESRPAGRLATHRWTSSELTIAKLGIQRKGARNLWVNASAGKVRPVVREPSTTHYCCSCCRWSA
jgi:hypothetical protein